MREHFPICYAEVVKLGFPQDNSEDPNVRSAFGLTQVEVDAWCMLHNAAPIDVFTSSPSMRSQIFFNSYWHPYCDVLPIALDFVFFDTAIYEGMFTAVAILQRCLGLKPDGHMGVVTGAKVRGIQELSAIVAEFMAQRRTLDYARTKSSWTDWQVRLDMVLATAEEMLHATQSSNPMVA